MIIREPHLSWVEFAQTGPKRKKEILDRGEAFIGFLYYPEEDITPYEVALILRYGRDIEAGFAHPSLFAIVSRHYLGVELSNAKKMDVAPSESEQEQPLILEVNKPPAKKAKTRKPKVMDEVGVNGI